MKVELVSIGSKLLYSDMLDTNSAYLSRYLHEAGVPILCKATVGDDLPILLDVLRVALARADVVIATGGAIDRTDGLIRQAVAILGKEGGGADRYKALGGDEAAHPGLLVESEEYILVCLPGDRRETAHLLTTEALPYLRKRFSEQLFTAWATLHTVGVVESSLRKKLEGVGGKDCQLSYDFYAGQTNIQLVSRADDEKIAEENIKKCQRQVIARAGDFIFGKNGQRLDDVVLGMLEDRSLRLAIAECSTDENAQRPFADRITRQTAYHLPSQTHQELQTLLELDEEVKTKKAEPTTDLSTWCRVVAENIVAKLKMDLGLLSYTRITPGGVQLIVTLASPNGVSITQRSFGGHPDNIGDWIYTLGFSHIHRWLLANK